MPTFVYRAANNAKGQGVAASPAHWKRDLYAATQLLDEKWHVEGFVPMVVRENQRALEEPLGHHASAKRRSKACRRSRRTPRQSIGSMLAVRRPCICHATVSSFARLGMAPRRKGKRQPERKASW